MRRILLMVLRNLLIVPGGWIKLCYRASHVDKYTEEDNYEFLRWIVFRANKGGNVTIDVHGQENIPKQDGFMFFPNHQGLYDVLAIVEACTHPFSVVAKKEVENVPFLKQVFKIMKAFMIDREDPSGNENYYKCNKRSRIGEKLSYFPRRNALKKWE